MATMMNTNFDPGKVLLGGKGSQPYLPTSPVAGKNLGNDANTLPLAVPRQPNNVLAPEAIRATGTGPYDSAYRQNLATYAGGQFERPNGFMGFNPTDPNSFPGQPTGGGNAPLPGLPNSLVSNALGGSPFSVAQPQQTQTTSTDTVGPDFTGNWQDWLRRFRGQGRMFGLME